VVSVYEIIYKLDELNITVKDIQPGDYVERLIGRIRWWYNIWWVGEMGWKSTILAITFTLYNVMIRNSNIVYLRCC